MSWLRHSHVCPCGRAVLCWNEGCVDDVCADYPDCLRDVVEGDAEDAA